MLPGAERLETPVDAAATEALHAALQQLAGQRPLTLAPQAFVEASELILECTRPRAGAVGRIATGRELEAPLIVRLQWQAGRCALQRADDGRRIALYGLRCRPRTACSRAAARPGAHPSCDPGH